MLMFKFFKGRQDATEAEQREEIVALQYPPALDFLKEKMLVGESCDQIPGAEGLFGHAPTNPIPVNGPVGEVKYLNRLRVKGGPGVFYHRLGSRPAADRVVSAFETVSLDGTHWDVLYFDMRHPRRSKLVPEGYEQAPFDKMFNMLRIGFGMVGYDENFPHSIPEYLRTSGGSPGAALAKRVERVLAERSWERPASQMARFRDIQF